MAKAPAATTGLIRPRDTKVESNSIYNAVPITAVLACFIILSFEVLSRIS